MKNQLMAAAAVLALMSASTVAYADDQADVKALKAQAAELKKQNDALAQRLSRLEQTQTAASSSDLSSTDFLAQVTKGPLAVVTDDGPICWKGICIFGGVDGGLSWASHGMTLNDKYYNGNEFITKNANHSYFGFNPNGLSNSNVGIKGSVELLPGLSGVFMASTLFNPQSGQLQNAPGSLIQQNGLGVGAQSLSSDGSRGGQAFNDQLYVGVSHKEFGTLTFGRHKTLMNDLLGAYDVSGAPAFSYIAYSGSVAAGASFTGYSRWDDSFKYKVEYGPVRFGAMYAFANGTGGQSIGPSGQVCNGPNTAYVGTNTPANTVSAPGCTASVPTTQVYYAAHNDAAQFDLGGSYAGFDIDGVLGYHHQVINAASLNSAQNGGLDTFTNQFGVVTRSGNNSNGNTLSGTAADATNGAIGVKYTWEQWKFGAGWSHIILHNPKDAVGIGGEVAQGGYTLSSVTNGAYPHARLLDAFWFGVKYAYDPKTDIVGTYQYFEQNNYGAGSSFQTAATACHLNKSVRSGTCAGDMNQFGAYVDYHFTKRFDVYGGFAWSTVGGGMAAGYLYSTDWTPTVGARFVF